MPLASILAGFTLGLSLIIAIGAQNLFILRQGVHRQHVVMVAVICAVSDAILIVFGVAGLGFIIEAAPWLIDAVRWAGAAFLFAYALLAARRAWRPSKTGLDVSAAATASALSSATGAVFTETKTKALPLALTCLALTWLNPHVYLDTVFLLGSVASTHGDLRWLFALGAVIGSVVWFSALAFGARYLSRWLSTPQAWRILDGVIAVVMTGLAISLLIAH
ncbi:LysE/ArgO family amino acid transporter [Microbacterium sp. NPDC076911]|uniref:LysE/ArgO family amino acid transporter n=1 Tax=Microbacterium sp. NPDC076911 TaxID=3154958 RepID=UPI003418C915